MRRSTSLVFTALAKVGLLDKTSLSCLLTHAAGDGYTSMAETLIKAGANVHFCYEGALREAVLWRRLETAKLLLEKGADPHANDDEPLLMAKKTGNIEMENLLRNYSTRAPV